MRTCSFCGTENKDSSKFCRECGKSLDITPEKAARKKRRTRFFRAVAVILMVALIAGGVAAGVIYIRPERAKPRSRLGVQDDPKIKQLIYPTLGNPCIIESGDDFTVEFDPREQEFEKPFEEVSGFKVRATSSNDPYPVEMDLPVESFQVGYSTQWPEYGESEEADRRMYLVKARVPNSLPLDLYDLTVEAKKGSMWAKDSQPHALQAIDEHKDPFSFCQLTDIHVWGPEIFYPTCNYHLRNKRHSNYDPKDGYGAEYYHKAIQQLNIIKPDFCIFSGDYMYGQAYFTQDNGRPWGTTSEYEYEMEWFYQETLKLDVPVFMAIGNHDGYNEGETGAKEDWFDNWRKFYGPLYHSFDYGDYHFLMLNSMDWSAENRLLNNAGIALIPTKYKGQFRGGGDKWEPGFSLERIDAVDESKFTGQLAWIRDDLAANMGAKARICVMHHDPWRKAGYGDMWASGKEGFLDFLKSLVEAVKWLMDMGDGDGRLAIIKLMKDYNVSLEISGHKHDDYVAVVSLPWSDGSGQLKFVNTTSTQFESNQKPPKYPGYRRIWIGDGRVLSFNYKEPGWSYPWWKGTNVGGVTDLKTLTVPAVECSLGQDEYDTNEATCTIKNHLEKDLPGAFMEFPMPYLSDGYYYEVANGRFAEVFDDKEDSPDRRICQVRTDVAPGEEKSVTVRKSGSPDTTVPTGGVVIEGGATTVSSGQVNLKIEANDPESGVEDMMISNSSDFDGATWEHYRGEAEWNLASGDPGPRTVYVKLRNRAMPPGESSVIQSSVECPVSVGGEEPANSWHFRPGDCDHLFLEIDNQNDYGAEVQIVAFPAGSQGKADVLIVPPGSRLTMNVGEAFGMETDDDLSLHINSSIPLKASCDAFQKQD